MKSMLIVALLLLLVVPLAHAEDAPALSGKRASLALQAGGAWQSDGDGDTDPEAFTGVVALVPAYSLGSTAAIVAPVRYGLADELLSFEPRGSIVVLQGRTEVALQAGFAFFNDKAEEQSEPFVCASTTIALGGKWALSFPAWYGTTSQQGRLEAKLSFLAGGQ